MLWYAVVVVRVRKVRACVFFFFFQFISRRRRNGLLPMAATEWITAIDKRLAKPRLWLIVNIIISLSLYYYHTKTIPRCERTWSERGGNYELNLWKTNRRVVVGDTGDNNNNNNNEYFSKAFFPLRFPVLTRLFFYAWPSSQVTLYYYVSHTHINHRTKLILRTAKQTGSTEVVKCTADIEISTAVVNDAPIFGCVYTFFFSRILSAL